MAVTTMPSPHSTHKHIRRDYPNLTFTASDTFRWLPSTNTIEYVSAATERELYLLLHELGHASLHHDTYTNDIGLLDMEREAWNYALSTLVPRYELDRTVAQSIADDALDSYREWLHRRSTCPNCSAVGIESTKHHYVCLVCEQTWRVNEARSCELKRYTT